MVRRRPALRVGLDNARLSPLFWLLLGIACSAMLGCATYRARFESIADSLYRQNPAAALRKLEAQPKSERDIVIHELNKGMLYRMVANFEQSNVAFENAKSEMERLYAASVSEQISAIVVNDSLRSYAGERHEQLFVHAYKALNYLALGDAESARVEILQADVKMRIWGQPREGTGGYALVRYVSGIVFEQFGQWDDALIAYRKAYEVLKRGGQPLPVDLQRDLLRLSQWAGLDGEHRRYSEQFGEIDWLPQAEVATKGSLFLLCNTGLVQPKSEHLVFAYHPKLGRHVYVALPYYERSPSTANRVQIRIAGMQRQSAVLEDINAVARQALVEATPRITARALARMLIKREAVRRATEENEFAGFLTEIAATVTERADTRSWTTLPARVEVARVFLAPGDYELKLTLRGAAGHGLIKRRARTDVTIGAGRTTMLTEHWIVSEHSRSRGRR